MKNFRGANVKKNNSIIHTVYTYTLARCEVVNESLLDKISKSIS